MNRKQTCPLCFLNVQIPRKQVQDRSKEFLGNKNNINKKRFLGKVAGHNDHYMINMDGQRHKIGG